MESYRIADEPRPGGLAAAAVNPMWPLFAFMFCGSWLAWPWFVLNGLAVGNPTLRREVTLAVGGAVGSAALGFAILAARSQGMLPGTSVQYAVLALIVWKLAVSYWLYSLQSRTFGIYEYYGGEVKNGFYPIVIGSFFVKGALFKTLDTGSPAGEFLYLVLL